MSGASSVGDIERASARLLEAVPKAFDLTAFRLGATQRFGAMTVVPIFGGAGDGGSDRDWRFAPPLTGLKLAQVRGYGNVELANLGGGTGVGVAIVPLHMGYIQDRAQNHALCRSALLGVGVKLMFEDACCVQQGQGGYLEGREQWFFVLPLQLRREALALRGQKGYGKLWPAISRLNEQFGLADRGHLEQIISRERAHLNTYQSRFERLAGQVGALFFLGTRLVGVEIAPSAGFFAEVWMPLVCFAYGVAATFVERRDGVDPWGPDEEPLEAGSLPELRMRLTWRKEAVANEVAEWLAATPPERFERIEEERYLALRLHTVIGRNFAGQYVEEHGQLVYASLFATPEWAGLVEGTLVPRDELGAATRLAGLDNAGGPS